MQQQPIFIQLPSAPMQRIYKTIQQVGKSNIPFFITGENRNPFKNNNFFFIVKSTIKFTLSNVARLGNLASEWGFVFPKVSKYFQVLL